MKTKLRRVLCLVGLHSLGDEGYYDSLVEPAPWRQCAICGKGFKAMLCGATLTASKEQMDGAIQQLEATRS